MRMMVVMAEPPIFTIDTPEPSATPPTWTTWPASDRWHILAQATGRTVTTSLDEITRGGPAFIIDRRAGFIELTDPPLRRTPSRPRTWPRGKWFALSRRARKSPPIVW